MERALAELPEQFQAFLDEVSVQVQSRPSEKMLRDLGLEDDQLLFGLYQGADLMIRSEVEGRGTPMPNHILIFQDDLELACDSEEQLVDEVRKTVLHELGHHFGMDEEDLDELGYA